MQILKLSIWWLDIEMFQLNGDVKTYFKKKKITSIWASIINLIGSSILIALFIASINAKRKTISYIFFFFWPGFLITSFLLIWFLNTASFVCIGWDTLLVYNCRIFNLYKYSVSQTSRSILWIYTELSGKAYNELTKTDLWYSNQLISFNANSIHWF